MPRLTCSAPLAIAVQRPLLTDSFKAPERDEVGLAASLASDFPLSRKVARAPKNRRRRRLLIMRTNQRQIAHTPTRE
jgi:hypothetical protein